MWDGTDSDGKGSRLGIPEVFTGAGAFYEQR